MDTFLVFPTATLGSTYFALTGDPLFNSQGYASACQTITVSLTDNTTVTLTQVDGKNKQVTLKNEKNMEPKTKVLLPNAYWFDISTRN